MAKNNLSSMFADKLVARSLYVLSFSGMMRRKVLNILKELEVSLLREVSQFDIPGSISQAEKQQRLQVLLKATQQAIRQHYGEISNTTITSLKDVARFELMSGAAMLNKVLGVDLISVSTPTSLISSLAKGALVKGAPSEEWWARQSLGLQNSFKDQMREGMLRGETIYDLTKRVRGEATGKRVSYLTAAGKPRQWVEFKGGIMDIQTRQAEALVRSSAMSVVNDARLEMYEQNDDVIKGVEALVTLDDRTSDFCQAMSGSSWSLPDHEPIGDSEPWQGSPPWHWNCRSTLVPITYSFEELAERAGGNTRAARELDNALGDLPTSVQASMDGEVSGGLTYEDWLGGQSRETQLDILGPGRLSLWEDGKLSLSQMVDSVSQRSFTLEELADRYGDKLSMPSDFGTPTSTFTGTGEFGRYTAEEYKGKKANAFITSAFSDAPEEMAPLISGAKKSLGGGIHFYDVAPGGGTLKNGSGAEYNTVSQGIYMTKDHLGEDFDVVLRHEYGHHIDYSTAAKAVGIKQPSAYNRTSASLTKLEAIAEDSDRLKATWNTGVAEVDISATFKEFGFSLDEVSDAIKQATKGASAAVVSDGVRAVALALKNKAVHSLDRFYGTFGKGATEMTMFEDFFSAITKNKYGGIGHSDAYYASHEGAATTEAFANWVVMRSSSNRTWEKLARILAPSTTKAFDEILAKTMGG